MCENERPTTRLSKVIAYKVLRIMPVGLYSYAWSSFTVTWQRWRSYHSIGHSRKPHTARKSHGSIY